jgi:amidase
MSSTLTKRDRFVAEMDEALEPWDAWICPVAVTAAFTHRPSWSAIDIDGQSYPHATANGIYLLPFNVSGHPAVVMPIGKLRLACRLASKLLASAGEKWNCCRSLKKSTM